MNDFVPLSLRLTAAEVAQLDRISAKQHRSRSSQMKLYILSGLAKDLTRCPKATEEPDHGEQEA